MDKYSFIYLDSVDSTNRYAKELDAAENTVIIARQQTAGRGRLGRSFLSLTDGIYMSVILYPTLFPETITLITTAAAVAVSRAIDEICGVKTDIKWVNDIYLSGKKVCGILCENMLSTSCDTPHKTVLGIGINLSDKMGALPKEIENIAGFVFNGEYNQNLKQNLIIKILDNFFIFYKNLEKKEFLEEYHKKLFIIGKTVTVSCGEDTFTANVIGLDDNAHLIVQKSDGSQHILGAGEVSLKL